MEGQRQQQFNSPPMWANNLSSGKRKVLFAVVAVLLLFGLAFAGYGIWKEKSQDGLTQCTLEAKICPDGSAVGRTGPNCEFALCPSEALCEGGPCPENTDTSNWKTYRNEEYGFEFKYPEDWQFSRIGSPSLEKPDLFSIEVMNLAKSQFLIFPLGEYGYGLDANLQEIQTQINISGHTGIKREFIYPDKDILTRIEFEKDKNFRIELRVEDIKDRVILDNILSTFKFIDSEFKTSGTVSGKVSIGPLCPVEPCQNTPDVYSSRKLIFTPTGGGRPVDEPLYAQLSSDGSYSIELPESNYSVTLGDCDYLGCAFALPKNIFVKANETLELNIDIDTGIR